MDKMRMESQDLTQANIEKIAELFPGVITEAVGEDGKLKKGVNFALLKQVLSDEVIEGDEAYEFTWVGKKASIVEAGKPIRKTLRPCKEESKNWESTENLYIEGDNLDVLKLLQESYLGKVKMIYIDPPYNTGNDFIYRDNFTMDKDDYDDEAGVYDEEGDKLFRNTESNGRFHSDWCSMMFPRLVLARNFLREDGVIFISCDDNEQDNLKKICNEIFGEANFIAAIIWQKVFSPKNSAKHFSEDHDYILVYARNAETWRPRLLPRTASMEARYNNPDNDPRGPWTSGDLAARNFYGAGTYPVTCPSGRTIDGPPVGSYWRIAEQKFHELNANGRIWWGENGDNTPRLKRFLSEVQDGVTPQTFWSYKDVGHTQEAKKELLAAVKFSSSGEVFETPKPIRLIQRMLRIATTSDEEDIVLDFFSGSASTGHAVMELNNEDGGNRRFILVQLPEHINSKDYPTIAEIGKERIRRAGEKIKADNAGKEGIENLDTGFRLLKLDSTNMKDVYYGADEYDQHSLTNLISNIKEDRDDMDLLYGCLLEWGLPLSLPHTSEKIDGVTVHSYNNGDLMACFAEKISEAVVREIAKRQPLRVVFRDNSFASAPAKINVEEIFKLIAPNTTVKVI